MLWFKINPVPLTKALSRYQVSCCLSSSPAASARLADTANQHGAETAPKQHDNLMLGSGHHSSLEGNLHFSPTFPPLLPSAIPSGGTSGSNTLDYTLQIYNAKQPFTEGLSINITNSDD